MTMRYYIIAGEASGDLHGSNLIKGLRKMDSSCSIRFWGGDMMAEAAGTAPVVHYKDGAVMGFLEVLLKAGKLLGNISRCKKDILEWKPDAVILIDYPGFNMRIARFCHEHGIRTLYYIAPKVWGWKEGRNKQLKRYVDRLFIVFPFEVPYFKSKGVDAVYVGNPLLDAIGRHPSAAESREDFMARHKDCLDPRRKYIALLAGSRTAEIDTMIPVLCGFMAEMKRRGYDYGYIIAGAPSRTADEYTSRIAGYRDRHPEEQFEEPAVLFSETYSVLRHSSAAVINSGTASLEAAIIGTPQAVGYIAGKISFRIAKHLVKLKYISLGNLILDKGAFREFLQDDCNPATLADEIGKILSDSAYRDAMLRDYASIRKLLGGEGASERVASEIIRFIGKGKD